MDLSNTAVYSLGGGKAGVTNNLSWIDVGRLDSVTPKRLIVVVNDPCGQKATYEYNNIKVLKNVVSYTFRRWILYSGKKRMLHYGYTATAKIMDTLAARPTLAQIEAQRGNRINFQFTTDDGSPLAKQKISANVLMNGYQIVSELCTDSLGKATGYYPDHYFVHRDAITILLKYEDLKSSVVLEKRYCPILIKRVLTSKQDNDNHVVAPPNN